MKRTIFLALVMSTLSLAQACPLGPYVYYADVIDVYDADTITANIDLGFHTWRREEKLRLAGIDAPEVRGKEKTEGKISRDWLRGQILNQKILIKTIKIKKKFRGKYGRYLVEVYRKDGDDCTNLNDELVRLGYAEKYKLK